MNDLSKVAVELTDPHLTIGDLLDCLVEECAEVIQAAQKCKRFGWDRVYPGYGSNMEILSSEVGDLYAILDAIPLHRGEVKEKRDGKLRKIAKHKREFGNELRAAPQPQEGSAKA